MSNIQIIENILNNKFQITDNKLVEEGVDRFGEKFSMTRNIVCPPVIENRVYQYDIKEEILVFFQDEKDVKKMCDYILFIEHRKSLFVYLVELKKTTAKAKKQLDAGECFAKYIIATAERISETPISEVIYRKIRICESHSKKKTLRKNPIERENGVIDSMHTKDFRIEEFFDYSEIQQ